MYYLRELDYCLTSGGPPGSSRHRKHLVPELHLKKVKMCARLRQVDPGLAELLWETLLHVEASERFKAEDPIFLEFRKNVLRIIADLEILKSHEKRVTEDTDEAKSG